MRFNNYLLYILLAAVVFTAQSCKKTEDCTDSSANLPAPVPQTKFRIIDAEGRDLLAPGTPEALSFDSLVARQPCHIDNALPKKKVQTGAGGLESYYFYFDNMRQPITGENKECFTLLLQWGADDVDTIEFMSRAEHHVCGITYHLDGVKFNGKDTQKDPNGNYLLQK
ncbi:MAG TPA: hypothetical protein VEB40_03820 [Flavipsychrobacter sp.]|nr:hypothetical protein [Flavipsychrobacter sp.]